MLTTIVEQAVIGDVEVREIKSHGDERGFFREVARIDDTFFVEGFTTVQNVVLTARASNWQKTLNELVWLYIPTGDVQISLQDCRHNSPSYGTVQKFLVEQSKNNLLIKIPAKVTITCQATSEFCSLIFIGQFANL